jgi:hypothetical protein
VSLEQFCNFHVIDTHSVVVCERFLYQFVRSYKNIYQMHFRPEEKELLTARLVLILLSHGHSCSSSVTLVTFNFSHDQLVLAVTSSTHPIRSSCSVTTNTRLSSTHSSPLRPIHLRYQYAETSMFWFSFLFEH